MLASAREIQFVELVESGFEEGVGRIGFDSDARLRGGFILRAHRDSNEEAQGADRRDLDRDFVPPPPAIFVAHLLSNLRKPTRGCRFYSIRPPCLLFCLPVYSTA